MEQATLEFEMLFKEAKKMNIPNIEECKPNNISCLENKIKEYKVHQEELLKLIKEKEEEIALEQIKKDVEKYSNKNVPKHKLNTLKH
jgi:hypothetical protein